MIPRFQIDSRQNDSDSREIDSDSRRIDSDSRILIPSRPAADIDSILIPDKLILTRNRFHDFLDSIPGFLGIDFRNI